MPPVSGLMPHPLLNFGRATTKQETRIHHFIACHFRASDEAFALYELI